MDIFELLDEQWKLLQQHGFDEKSLSFPAADARFMDQLSNELAEKMHLSQFVPGIKGFRVGLSGLFDGDKDLVHYNFQYRYNPSDQSLHIETITARLKDTRLDFTVPERSSLPRSNDIYQTLKQERSVEPVQENREEKTWRQRL